MTKSTYELLYQGGMIMAIVFFAIAVILFIVLKIPKAFGDLTGLTAKKSIKGMKSENTRSSASKREQAKYYGQGSGKIKTRQGVSQETRVANRDNTTDALRRTAILNKGKKNRDFEETEVLSGVKTDIPEAEETEVLMAATENDETTDVLKVAAGDDEATDVLKAATGDDEATDVLKATAGDDEATDVLKAVVGDDEATDVLKAVDTSDEATDVLRSQDEDETSVLCAEDDEDSTSVLYTNRVDILARKVKVLYNIVEVHTEESL